jgi:hypothetical protein
VSTFVITARSCDAALVGELRRLMPSMPVTAIRDALAMGAPLVECDLYGNDHGEAAAQLLAAVEALQRFGATIAVEEIDGDERSVESVEYLRRVIERHAEIRRQSEGRP